MTDVSTRVVRLLLVDDDPRYGDYLRALLRAARRTRFEVVAVGCAAEGLRHLTTSDYDACLLDYRLGTEDGLGLLRQAYAHGLRLPVILLTGAGDPALEMTAFAEGATDYLEKTEVEPARLERAIVHAIARHRAQKQLELELRQAQKMEAVGRLAGGVAHDFNNLLTAILGYAELLGDTAGSTGDRAAIAEIQRAATSAAALTRQLLAFSRKQVLHTEVVRVDAVVGRIVSLLRRVLGEDITIETLVPPGMPPVDGDQVQLEQVLLNLAVNARDAMPAGGRLTIATGAMTVEERQLHGDVFLQPGRYVTIAVQDTGCGMDADTKMRMFEPFFTTKQTDKGTGLGLSTVYGIVKQSGGEIGCDTAIGVGTTFTIYLPASERALDQAADEARSARGGLESVLLVEDDEAVRRLGRAVLEQWGYTVVDARHAEEALRAAVDRTFDLLLTDVVMPHVSGLELAVRLRRCQPSLRVLFMSGFATNIEQERLDEIGTLLPKPFTPSALAAKVREVLDGATS
jgi:signal transduction histidine kinase